VSNKCVSSVLYINLHLHVTVHIYILSVINKFIMYEFLYPYIPVLYCKSFRSNFIAFPYFATVPTIAEVFTVSQGKLLLFPVNTTWCYVLSSIASPLFSLLDHPTIRGCQYLLQRQKQMILARRWLPLTQWKSTYVFGFDIITM
jgi:hypothetical protein